jgi:PadR family transcriptional regulator PadR
MASQAAVKILRAFLEEPDQEQYGFGIMRSTGLKSASVYPMLDRLEQSGWILGYDEDIDERTAGRRRRRLYKLSPTGEREARKTVERFYRDLGPAPSWLPRPAGMALVKGPLPSEARL